MSSIFKRKVVRFSTSPFSSSEPPAYWLRCLDVVYGFP